MIDLTWNSRILLGLSQLNWADAELYLLHVIDTRPLQEFGLAAGALPARKERTAERLREMRVVGRCIPL